MLTNLVFKKFANYMMMIAMYSMMFMTIGCSDTEDGPVAPNTNDDIVTFTGPDGEEIQISQTEIDKFATQSQAYENMIEAMDPYVTENQDGTYRFDADAFMATNSKMNELGNKVYSNLAKGIPVINQKILAEKRSSGSTALSSYCNYYWWGACCCYTGSQGWSIVSIVTISSWAPPPLKWISRSLAVYLGWYMSVYGGFCLNQSWIGGQWITHP